LQHNGSGGIAKGNQSLSLGLFGGLALATQGGTRTLGRVQSVTMRARSCKLCSRR
jgi:hypothetical protein